jgi:hypothetical protein
MYSDRKKLSKLILIFSVILYGVSYIVTFVDAILEGGNGASQIIAAMFNFCPAYWVLLDILLFICTLVVIYGKNEKTDRIVLKAEIILFVCILLALFGSIFGFLSSAVSMFNINQTSIGTILIIGFIAYLILEILGIVLLGTFGFKKLFNYIFDRETAAEPKKLDDKPVEK